ncbi:MAG TPA: hypothetical protein VFA33_23435 [Bryobacteraceae bacterium]|nr:hypothetical protein [Bryobacteraceae bacterium]
MRAKATQRDGKGVAAAGLARQPHVPTQRLAFRGGPAAMLLRLQQTHGNRYVQRLLSGGGCFCGGSCPSCREEAEAAAGAGPKAGGQPPDAAAPAPAAPAPAAPAPAPAPTAPAAAPEAPAPAPGAPVPAPAAPAAAPSLNWTHQLRHPHDALWFFCGEHPSGFSITADLVSANAANPAALQWRITAGADKIAFDGASVGPSVRVKSTAGSVRANDVSMEVREGTPGGASYTGKLTVRKPHRLLSRGAPTDHAGCPPWNPCPGCGAYWTEISYRIVDNVGGTIVGATVNENFPGAVTADVVTNWPGPAAFATVPFWQNTNGTFVDNWFIGCGNPTPVAPTDPTAGTSVDHMPHEFYVGSVTPARGCRVQTHTAHRYLGFARHEGIVSPAP